MTNLNAVNDMLLAVRVETRHYAEVRDLLLTDAAVEAFRADRMTEVATSLAFGEPIDKAVERMRHTARVVRECYSPCDPDVLEARRQVAAREAAISNA